MSILKIWTLVEVNSGILAQPQSFLNEAEAEKAYIDRANELFYSSATILEKEDKFTTKLEVDEYQSFFEVKDDLRLFCNEIEMSDPPILDAIEVEIPMDGIPFQKHNVTEWMIDNKKGAIIADGFIPNSPDGIYMTDNDRGRMLRYVIKIGAGNDWAIYVDWSYKTAAQVGITGEKVTSDENILKLVNCTPKVLKMYRK